MFIDKSRKGGVKMTAKKITTKEDLELLSTLEKRYL